MLTRVESAAFWRSGEGSGPGQRGAGAVAGAWGQSEVQRSGGSARESHTRSLALLTAMSHEQQCKQNTQYQPHQPQICREG